MSILCFARQAAQNNGSVYVHAYFAPTGLPLNPDDPFYDARVVFHQTSSARPMALGLCYGMGMQAPARARAHHGVWQPAAAHRWAFLVHVRQSSS